MKIREINVNDIKNLTILKPEVYEDFRGEFVETYNKNFFKEKLNLDLDFVQDDISVSYKNVLRGLHGDYKTWKLVSCLYGRIYLVVLDPKTKQHASFTLTDINRTQILIPPGSANGHLILSDMAIFSYKQTEYYDRDSQFTIRYDENYDIYWPIKNPILSIRDNEIKKNNYEN